MRCPKCGAENREGAKFCGECAAQIAAEISKSATHQSSSPSARVAGGQTEAQAGLEGERKTVTALFADIKGSTELMEELDPEEVRAIVDPALKLMI